MAIEIVIFPMNNVIFHSYVRFPDGICFDTIGLVYHQKTMGKRMCIDVEVRKHGEFETWEVLVYEPSALCVAAMPEQRLGCRPTHSSERCCLCYRIHIVLTVHPHCCWVSLNFRFSVGKIRILVVCLRSCCGWWRSMRWRERRAAEHLVGKVIMW